MEPDAGVCLRFSGRKGERSVERGGVLTPKPPKPKKCRVCRELFTPTRAMQICCTPKCAIEKARQDRCRKEGKEATRERVELRKTKDKAKTRREWIKDAQTSFNAFIRARDDKLPCISCGRHHQGQYHAGHYMPTSTRPSLRFNELNVHKQCSACNNHLHGNLVNYRVELIKKIGLELVEWLEGEHVPAKYTIPELIGIRDNYRLKLKELRASV